MISLVLVSHSRKLAEGLLDLLRQVTPPSVQIAEAAGVGPDYSELGTDSVHIAEVIQSVYSPDGVLVLMDLGSALISAEMALEFLPEQQRGQVLFCPAPFVEGALAAGVQAGLGSDLQTVYRESQNALAAKIDQLSPAAGRSPEPAPPINPSSITDIHFNILAIRNPHGLHLRPAAQLVQTAARFLAEIKVWNQSTGSGPVSVKSINALAMLNVRQGDTIRISASGPEAEEAIQALGELVENNFGEGMEEVTKPPPDREPVPLQDAKMGGLRGVPISPGVAVAPLYYLKREAISAPSGQSELPEKEWRQLEQALRRVKENLQKRQSALLERLGNARAASKADILYALGLILEDPELIQRLRRRILEEGMSAASTWQDEIRQLKESYSGLSDTYLQQRAADITDIGRQVLAELAGKTSVLNINSSLPVILYAYELTPTETAQLDPSLTAGLITASGGETSHSAILARALGIPAVSSIDLTTNDVPDGTLLVLDGSQGLVLVDPVREVRIEYEARKQDWIAKNQNLQAHSHKPALLKNGRRIQIFANIGSPAEAQIAMAQGAEGVGLLRTEFLFLSRTQPPSEEEQASALQSISQSMQGRPVIVRTLDVGGDKPLPYLAAPDEANPFLGVRAVRLALRHPDLFQAQLRAILRAAQDYPLSVMFPMIANMDDLLQAREQLETAHSALFSERVPHRWPVETGIMVETPSAALLSDQLAPLVDFFSIGTNDLTQYTLAADRGNPLLAEYTDALHPAVLNLIQQVVKSAKKHGKQVGICGELAGDPLSAPVLVGLGLDEFSMNPAAIPRIKEIIRGLDEVAAVRLAEKALQMDSAASVRALLKGMEQ